MANQQIWVRAVGSHTSNSVMVSLKAPTGDTELAGLGYGRLYSPQVGTLDPERSYAAQGIAKGATLSLIPRLIVGGMGCCSSKLDNAQISKAEVVKQRVSSPGAGEAISGLEGVPPAPPAPLAPPDGEKDEAPPRRDVVGSDPADGVQGSPFNVPFPLRTQTQRP